MQRNVLSQCQALAVVLGLAGPAFAQAPRQVRFEYERQDGAAACPDLAAIQAGVAARLGYDPFDGRASDRLRTTIRQSGHDLEARIEMTDAQGALKAERKLLSHQRDCAELASSVELAVSIAIDPFRLNPSSAEQGAREQASQPAAAQIASQTDASPPPVDRAEPAPSDTGAAPAQGRPLSGQAWAGVLGAIGVAPSIALGFVAGAGIRGGNLSLGIEGRVDLPASKSLRVGEVSTSLLAGSLLPCWHFHALAACALATAGVRRAAGHGLDDARRPTLAYLAAGARLAAAIPLTLRLSVALHGDVTAPFTQTKLKVDDTTVWTSPAISFALGAGMAATFP